MGFRDNKMVIIIPIFLVFGLTYVTTEEVKDEQLKGDFSSNNTVMVGKPLISVTKIHKLNDSKTKDEDEKLVTTTLAPESENSSSSFVSDYFSFIEEYPDYMRERDDFEDYEADEEEEEEEIFDINQDIRAGDSNETISMREDCQCGLPNINRIVGGAYTNIVKYPWNVQILLRVKKFPFCGGSIINSLYILTAAHCLEGLKATALSVRAGHTSGKQAGMIFDVLSIRMHEKYNGRDVTKHDIGLIRLKQPLNFTDKILPVCLHTRTNFANVNAIVTGWGRVSETGKYSDVLKEAAVSVYEYDYCKKVSKYRKSDIHSGILCARRKRTDACQGDSGGPLVYFEPSIKRFIVIGLTSYGIGCARFVYPGIYTKVVVYRSWILTHTADSKYCPV